VTVVAAIILPSAVTMTACGADVGDASEDAAAQADAADGARPDARRPDASRRDGAGAREAAPIEAGLDAPRTDSAGEADSASDVLESGDGMTGSDRDSAPDSPPDEGVDAPSGTDAGDSGPIICPPIVHSGSSAVSYHMDNLHSGAQPSDTIALPLCERWSYDLANGVTGSAISGGLVFILVVPSHAYPTVTALDEVTGSVAWGPVEFGDTNASETGGVAVDGDQVFAVTGDGVLAAFDTASGTSNWQTTLTGQILWQSAPVAGGGLVVVTGAADGVTTYAVRESDGTVSWTSEVANDTSSPTMTTDAVFQHDDCGAIYSLDLITGSLLWSTTGTCVGGGNNSVSILAGELFVPDVEAPPGAGEIASVATGTPLGTFNSNCSAVGGGGVGYYVPYSTHVLTAVPFGGTTPIWTAGSSAGCPLVVGSNVIVDVLDGLEVLSMTDGTLLSEYPVPYPFGFVPLQEADGVLITAFYSSSGASLVAF
jgi:hypothetical protein